MKKFIALVLVFITICALCACGPSKEAQAVIDRISSLPEITLESGTELDSIKNAYDALSDKEKEDVENISVLNEANAKYEALVEEENKRKEEEERLRLEEEARIRAEEDKVKELDKAIRFLGMKTFNNEDEIEKEIQEINSLYSKIDDEFKGTSSEYKNIDKYRRQVAINSSKALARDYRTAAAKSIVSKYKDDLSNSEKLSILGEIGFYSCIDDALSTLSRINRGKVYKVKSVNAKCTDEQGRYTSYIDGENCIEGTITISGTNAFGGSYEQDIEMFYKFNISIENFSVTGVTGITY